MTQTEYFGIGSLQNLRTILESEAPKTIFLVTGKTSYDACGAKRQIDEICAGRRIIHFTDFQANPKFASIEKGLKLFSRHNPDLVIAVGGGSPMDVAKLINLAASNPGEFSTLLKGERPIEHPGKPFVAIPTTSGSGSEATRYAVAYLDRTKYSIAHDYAIPDYAILDPSLTLSLPPLVVASTGMDALGQAIESYWSIHSTSVSKHYAEEAIRLVLKHLEPSVNRVDLTSRILMVKAANLAGKAINITQTTACHAISYPLTAYFGVSHGHGVGLTLGSLLIYNALVSEDDVLDKRRANYVKKTIAQLVKIMGAKNIEEAASIPSRLMESIGLSTRLRDLGIDTDEALETIVKNGFNPTRVANNPRRLTENSLRTILKSIQ